ncbi:hypothetical protein JOY44_12445 [Phormidium sp. CLA17]|uniref:hypothetical protein n=1 Tax=Leptolyngbya sp. Cla-17 TaxID=2803751 RepID=UPI0014925FC6|nr:hypothetical protein [Leptolyngbya sp. Cla-17]MBM0742416.1 hypothetical protein [Leptolyngbya sp. Cla-17]
MASSSKTFLDLSFLPRLPRSLSGLETWGFGLSGLLLWLGTAPAMHVDLKNQAIWVWLPGAIVGILLNLQIRHLGTHWQDMAGGTPNYTTRLLKNQSSLARYVAIGYWLGWVSVPAVNAIILTDLIKANLEPLGVPCPELMFKVGFTALPFIAFPAPVRYKLKAQTLALYYSARTSSDRKPLYCCFQRHACTGNFASVFYYSCDRFIASVLFTRARLARAIFPKSRFFAATGCSI